MLWKCATILLLSSILFECNAFAQELDKDSILLFNAQLLIGNIESAQLGEILIDDKDLGKLEVKQYKIRRINSYRRFRIQMNDKNVYFGSLKGGSKDGLVKIIQDDSTVIETNITNINLLIALEKNFFKRLDGSISAGFSYTKSSDLGQVNVNASASYITDKFEYFISWSAISSLDSGEVSRDRADASIFVAYNFRPTWFIGTSFQYQRNLELSIARRFQQLLGVGHKLFIRRFWQLSFLSGISFNEEKSTSGTTSELLLEIPLAAKFNFFRYRKPNIQVSASEQVFISLTQKGRVRYDNDISFSWEMFKDFYFTLHPYSSYDSQPPDGSSNFDFGIAISVAYKF